MKCCLACKVIIKHIFDESKCSGGTVRHYAFALHHQGLGAVVHMDDKVGGDTLDSEAERELEALLNS